MNEPTTFSRINVSQVKELGAGKFSVRLSIEGPEGAIAQTQTVLADGPDSAVQIAKEQFEHWLRKVIEQAVKNIPTKMRN